SEYNSAVSAHPGDVIVLHLNGNYTVGANPLTLGSDTCVLLGGTIQINSSTTATHAITANSGSSDISISGGLIDGGSPGIPTTGRNGIYFSGVSMFQIDDVTLQHFGTNSTRVGGSDVIQIDHGSTPRIITRCTINGGSARGIWMATSGVRDIILDNLVTDAQMDGVDFDESSTASLAAFNTLTNNTRYGVFIEQSASYNLVLGNVCNFDSSYGVGCYNNYSTPRAMTAYNSIICNSMFGGNGLRNGSTGDGTNVETCDNFYFNNTLANARIVSQLYGTNNYYSQNYLSGASISTSGAEVFFNSPDVNGNLQIHQSNSALGVIVQNASTTNNAPVVTATFASLGNGTGDDQWQLIPTDSGYYKVINKNSGLAMVVQGASTTNGAPIIQYAYSADGTYNDEWMIQSVGNGLYQFVNRLSGLCLDVPGGSTNAGTQLDQASSTGGAYQQFSLVEDTPASSAPGFSLSASPASQSVTAGNGTNYTINVGAINGFSGAVSLSVGGLPAGATATLSPTSVAVPGSSTLTITTSSSTPTGSHAILVTGVSGSLTNSTSATLVVNPPSTLPAGWTDADIGSPTIAGSATYSNGTFTVSGSGSDIWTTADQFNYTYQSVSGDQTVIARVVSENGTASYAKAGVMIRETTAANSVEASVLITPTNGIAMEVRPSTGAASINMTGWIRNIL
ncbi:MAG: RICIN domain-containing protein, partial [Verrucomicrobia bacterium]|nr:RICIN domain-containing protein [Verrucomicrobiota bacterium]